ncbi:hypothetical protein SADUNF_Sadunf04G0166200 [Salix dunnii]|uniref:Uncharacterized protein n=1 Tax=Salix dunnii TaxID=1413687 RepID=A0A835KC77_9ROSI|nr:hypothetical protein SADUNF_Sadunf04G0166200 [Salix dunnii]
MGTHLQNQTPGVDPPTLGVFLGTWYLVSAKKSAFIEFIRNKHIDMLSSINTRWCTAKQGSPFPFLLLGKFRHSVAVLYVIARLQLTITRVRLPSWPQYCKCWLCRGDRKGQHMDQIMIIINTSKYVENLLHHKYLDALVGISQGITI